MATTNASQRMKCRQCGYVYDPATGVAKGGIAPGVAFADLSDDWVCPTCRAPQDSVRRGLDRRLDRPVRLAVRAHAPSFPRGNS